MRPIPHLLTAALLLTSITSVHGQTTELSNVSAKKDADVKLAAGEARVLSAGDKVRVSSSGGWYDATVLETGDAGYKIRYDGWGSAWDEWVSPGRMQRIEGGPVALPPKKNAAPASQTAPAAPSSPVSSPAADAQPAVVGPAPKKPVPASEPLPPPVPRAQSTSPVGRWECRTWGANQVNRVGEFVLQADGRYQDVLYGGSGRYRFDQSTNAIVFLSGPQKTQAGISFNPSGHAGRGHIVFDYGGGAKLDCYRAASR